MPLTITDAAIEQVNADLSSIHGSRLKNLQAWLQEGTNPYLVTRFKRSHEIAALQAQYADLPVGEKTEDEVMIAGRIMAVRNSGMFIVLQDSTGTIQTFNHVKELNEAIRHQIERLDLGDIVGVRGIVRRTPRGELTIDVTHDDKGSGYVLMAKSLEPLPEKYHGIADPELEVRERHKSIATDADVRNRLTARSKILSAMRRTLEDDGFLEVETPTLQPIAGGASAKPFTTHHNALDIPLFLRIAPELYLKRLIASGISERVFEIGKNFRNEGVSPKHNPEFTSLEAYVAYANFEDMIDLTERLVINAVEKINNGSTTVVHNDVELNFAGPWQRKSMTSLVQERTGVDFAVLDTAAAHAAAKKLGVDVHPNAPWGKVIEAVFGERVEEHLIQPIHVTDLPADVSPLAKPNPKNPLFAERFETYVAGREIANAFSELNDPFTQHRYFAAQLAQRNAGDEEATEPDNDYVKVLEFGLPATGGLGIGLDRLVMLLTNATHIRQVILFPAARPDNNAMPSVAAVVGDTSK